MRRLLQTQGADAVLAAAAAAQHGVVGRFQLLGWGLTPSAVDRRLRAGRLHLVHRGVYAVGYPVRSRESRWMTAVLASGPCVPDAASALATMDAVPGAVLSHRSAAALWGIRSFGGAEVDVTVARKSRSSGWIRRRRSLLAPDEVTVELGIPLTTVPRTVFDMAATEPAEAVEAMLRESEYLRLYDRLSLPDLLERYPGRRGSRLVVAALAPRGAEPAKGTEPSPERIRSPLEERFGPFVERHRLPRPRCNAHVEADGRWHEVDCYWSAAGEIVELDGWEGHGTRGAFRADRARDRRLRAAGYGVTRLTWSQLDDEPEAIARDLRVLLLPPAAPG